MNRTTVLAVAIAALVMPAPASAAFIHDPAGNTVQPYAGWAATSREPAPNADVTLYRSATAPEVCHFNPACTVVSPAPFTMYVSGTNRSQFQHELGHIFDYSMMNDEARGTFLSIMGERSRAWRSTPNSPHEQFAEGYRLCSLYGAPLPAKVANNLVTYYGFEPSPRAYARICKLIRRVGTGT